MTSQGSDPKHYVTYVRMLGELVTTFAKKRTQQQELVWIEDGLRLLVRRGPCKVSENEETPGYWDEKSKCAHQGFK